MYTTFCYLVVFNRQERVFRDITRLFGDTRASVSIPTRPNFHYCVPTVEIPSVVLSVLVQSSTLGQCIRGLAKNFPDLISPICFQKTPVVHLSHVDFPHVGSWTILPMIEHLANIHNEGTTANWFVFLEDRTRLALDNTRKTLSKHNYKKVSKNTGLVWYFPNPRLFQKIFLGYALRDREPTIIHHFAFFENPGAFKYPNAASGFAISATLLHS